jgi:hypothetical protein
MQQKNLGFPQVSVGFGGVADEASVPSQSSMEKNNMEITLTKGCRFCDMYTKLGR